jgi:hypothetical protein
MSFNQLHSHHIGILGWLPAHESGEISVREKPSGLVGDCAINSTTAESDITYHIHMPKTSTIPGYSEHQSSNRSTSPGGKLPNSACLLFGVIKIIKKINFCDCRGKWEGRKRSIIFVEEKGIQ